MTLKDLISVLNMNITFNLIDYWSRQSIDYHNATRKELREIKSRSAQLKEMISNLDVQKENILNI